MKIIVLLCCFVFSLLFPSCDKIINKYYSCECTNGVSGEKIVIGTFHDFRLKKSIYKKRCKKSGEDLYSYTDCHIK